MSGLTDHQFGMVAESTYGTPVTVTRFLPILPDSTHSWDIRPIEGMGLITGSPFQRGARRTLGTGQGSIGIKCELQSKSLGLLLSHAMGTVTSTNVASTTYQQVHTPAATGTVLPASTMQFGVVEDVAAGTADPYTYSGCSVKGFTIDVPETGYATVSFDIDAKAVTQATGLASASYASAPSIFYHDSGATTIGGTVTAPTTTALATSAGTAAVNVRSWTLTVDNGLDVARWCIGGRNQPTFGKRTAKLSMKIEYLATTYAAAMIANTVQSFLCNLTTAEQTSSGQSATFQLAVPQMYLNSGALPNATDGSTVVTDVEFEIEYNGTDQPFYLTLRTTDTAA